jgi:TusA-related sulfurtransferase
MKILDVRGEICPVPLVETVREIEKMNKGETLKVLLDHPPARRSIPLEMKEQGHEFRLIDKGADFEIIIEVR